MQMNRAILDAPPGESYHFGDGWNMAQLSFTDGNVPSFEGRSIHTQRYEDIFDMEPFTSMHRDGGLRQ